MKINISEILSTPEKCEDYSVPIEMAALAFDGLTYPFLHKEPVCLTVSNIGSREISLIAKTAVDLSIPCDRCLETVTTHFDLDISKNIDFKLTDEEREHADACAAHQFPAGIDDNERINELDETCYIDHSILDVDQLVLNELRIDFPMKTLCKEDCQGFCPKCGQNLNQGECGCNRESLDPRMAAFRDVFKNFKEV